MMSRFNKSELESLCFELQVNYENLGLNRGEKSTFVRELIQYMDRHGEIGDLIAKVSEARGVHVTYEQKDNYNNTDLKAEIMRHLRAIEALMEKL